MMQPLTAGQEVPNINSTVDRPTIALLSFYQDFNRYPSWAEYSHYLDLEAKEFAIANNTYPEAIEKTLYIDVTQFIKQTSKTGIQRVVEPFTKMTSQNICLIYYRDYQFFVYQTKNSRDSKFFFFSKKIRKWQLFFVTKIAQLWEKAVTLFNLRELYSFKFLEKYAKKTRNFLLLINNIDYKTGESLHPSQLLQQNIFVPDLPSERRHLEILLFLSKYKIVNTHFLLHDLIPIIDPELMPINSTNEFLLYAKCLTYSETVITMTEKVKKDFINYRDLYSGSNNSQRVFCHGFPSEIAFNLPLETIDPVSHKFGELNKAPFVLAIGTILVRKNYALIVRALKILELQGVHCNFVICAHHDWGDESLEIAIHNTGQNKVFKYLNLDDASVHSLIKKSRIVVFPSLSEGFGLPILEGANSGALVLINDLEPMKELVKLNKNIVTVPEPTSQSWANSILHAMNFPNNLIGIPLGASNGDLVWEKWAKEVISKIHNETPVM